MLCGVLIAFSTAYAQFDSENVSLVSRYARGPHWSIAARGSQVFYGTGASLVIVDYENPEEPREVGEVILPTLFKGIAIDGDYAYLSVWTMGMYVVDISDIANPTIVGSVEGEVKGRIAYYSDHVYVMNEYEGVWIYNVSDPGNPEYVRRWESEGWVTDICIVDTVGYLLDNALGIQYLNLSEPGNPTDAGVYQVRLGGRTSLSCIEVSDGYALIGHSGVLRIWDISSPEDSTESHWFSLQNSTIKDIEVRDHYAFVGTSVGTWVIDWQQWDDLSMLFLTETSFGLRAIALGDDLIHLDGEGFETYDITDMENIELIDMDYNEGWNLSVEVKDNYAFLNTGARFLILDIEDIANPELISEIEMDPEANWGGEVKYVDDDYAYVVHYELLSCIDISDPHNPELVSEIETPTGTSDFFLRDTVGFLLHNGGMISFDMSDPANPEEISRGGSGRNEFTFYEHYTFNIGMSNRVHVVDISDITNMQTVETIGTPGTSVSLAIKDHYLYIGVRSGGIGVFDISNPAEPEYVGQYEQSPFGAGDMSINGNYLYTSSAAPGLEVFDISDAENPEWVGFHETAITGMDIAAKDEFIFVADWSDGLYIFQNDLMLDVRQDNDSLFIAQYGLISNYPNPFNSSTTLSFMLNQPGNVSINIFNALGKRQAELVSGNYQSGSQKVTWNASGLPSGDYFIRMISIEGLSSKKVTIIK